MYENLLANVPTDLWIGGKWRKASDGGRFDVIYLAMERKIASVASATVDDAKAALDAAEKRIRGLGGAQAARARGNPAQGLRADHARRRALREADHAGERKGAAGFARRGGLCRGILPLVRGRGRAQCRRGLACASVRRADFRASQACGHCGAGDALEFSRGDGDAQDRPGARGRLPGRAQACVRHAADHAGF